MVGVLLLVLFITEERMREKGSAISADAEGIVLVPGEKAPAFVTASIEIHIEIFTKVVGILNDGTRSEIIDDLGEIEVVDDPLTSLCRSGKIKPGHKIHGGIDITFVACFLFDTGNGVEKYGVKVTALNEFIKVAFLVVTIAVKIVSVRLLNRDADPIISPIDAELPEVGETRFITGEAVGIEGEGLANVGAICSATIDVDLPNCGHLFIDVE